MQIKCKCAQKRVDRNFVVMLSFICCVKRNLEGVCALDANKLMLKIFEKGDSVDSAIELFKVFCDCGQLSIADAIRLKEYLNLTDMEAIDIFLT